MALLCRVADGMADAVCRLIPWDADPPPWDPRVMLYGALLWAAWRFDADWRRLERRHAP